MLRTPVLAACKKAARFVRSRARPAAIWRPGRIDAWEPRNQAGARRYLDGPVRLDDRFGGVGQSEQFGAVRVNVGEPQNAVSGTR